MSKPRIRVQNLRKVFTTGVQEELLAIDALNFDVADKEFLCLLGPSGCGKSTCLTIMAGIEPPTSGELIVEHKSSTAGIGFVFQQPRLLPWRTARKNIQYSLENQTAIPKEKWDELTENVIRLVGLKGFENSFPNQLSGGMQTRVGIARALVIDPDILLMDEPFSNLDEITSRKMRRELLRIWRETEKTVVFVTHDVSEAVFLSDRVILLTRRPAKIYAEVRVDVTRPRKYGDPGLFAAEKLLLGKFEAMHEDEGPEE